MHNKIIICSDGTGNSGGKARGTNVWRLYQALDRDEGARQIAYYQDGVGTQGFKLFRMLGGAFGYGLNANIRDMYRFLVHNYRTGDDLYLFGFSRGAFTVRALANLLAICGIVKPDGDPKITERRIADTLRHYHRWRAEIRKVEVDDEGQGPAKKAEEQPLEERVRGYRSISSQPSKETEEDAQRPTIEFIGVWDTVDAVGLPIDELTEALDWLFKFRFYSYDRCPIAKHNYHALALDDERHSFHPVMWDEGCRAADQAIEQVWFPGVHSNVGGGYPKDGMAHVSLDWMMKKAEEVGGGQGLCFLPAARQEIASQVNANGKIYDSRSGLATYYRYKPRDVAETCLRAGAPVLIHESVFRRIDCRTEGYAPVSVPDDYAQTPSGGAHPTDQHKDKRMQTQHLADQAIWWRRILYFVLLTSTLGFLLIARRLAAVPLPAGEGGAGLLDRVLVTIAEFLPEILGKWLVAFSGRPGVVIFFILLFGGLFSFRGYLKRRTNYLGNMAWNLASGSATRVPPQTLIESIAVRIKGLYLPKTVRELVRTRLFPIGVLILVLALLGFWTANLFLLPKNHMACANKRDGFTRLAAGDAPVVLTDFHSCNPWYATGIEVTEGVDYHIQITERDEWADAGIPACASGLKEGASSIQDLFAITRRDPKEPWFRLLGDINDRQITIGRGTHFTPERGGPLHLYVNDAVCDLCLKGVFAYYRNNRGSAEITVTPIAGPATN